MSIWQSAGTSRRFNGAPDWYLGKEGGGEVLAAQGFARGFASDGCFGSAFGTS